MLRTSVSAFSKVARSRPSGKAASEVHKVYLEVIKAVQDGSQEDLARQLDRASALAGDNKMKSKDFALILHSVSKFRSVGSELQTSLDSLVCLLDTKVTRNTIFLTTLLPVDLVQIISAIAKLGKAAPRKDNTPFENVINNLSQEVLLKLPLFEDHHLALVLHAFTHGTAGALQKHVVYQIIDEIQVNRDVQLFSLQSVVMIANAVSRLQPKMTPPVSELYVSLIDRSTKARDDEMQANWPDVLLTAFAHSGMDPMQIHEEFKVKMAEFVLRRIQRGQVNSGRVAKATNALIMLKASDTTISKLRMHC
jgi:hypothetical protein